MRQDVTDAVRRIRNTYGGSDNTNPANVSANKSINYSSGNTLVNANSRRVTVAPSTFILTGEVGLFGVENEFIKIDLNILNESLPTDLTNVKADSDGYIPHLVLPLAETSVYTGAALNDSLDLSSVNDYAPSTLFSPLAQLYLPIVDIQLENIGTNNIYIDNHVDITLYTEDRHPVSDDNAFVSSQGCFFVGIHARKNRRLPYKIRVTIGERYVSLLDLNASERDSVLTKLGSSY
tara:strand:- start:1640 stop:2344 length:705 start_codon:yes stop_codon:yes gene_type:complete